MIERDYEIKYKNASHFLGFIALALVMLVFLGVVIEPRNYGDYHTSRNGSAYGIFDEPVNTVDVFYVGHSMVGQGISPMEIYKEKGITGYDLSQGSQKSWESVLLLERALEKQYPQVVVFDVDQLFYLDFFTYLGDALTNYFPITEQHFAWKDALPGDVEQRERNFTKGYQYGDKITPFYGDGRYKDTPKTEYLRLYQRAQIDKVVKMCDEKGIKLVLIELPSMKRWDGKKYNAIKKYADKKGLDFIDFNRILDELDFDWTTDSSDGKEHLNYTGALKVSRYLANLLSETYKVTDRRGDERYAHWQEDLAKYESFLEAKNAAKNA